MMLVLANAWRIARRELRGGVRAMGVVIACLALGVGAIAAVGTLSRAVQEGLREDGRRILGGDLEVAVGYRPMPEEARRWVAGRGAHLSALTELRAMLVAEKGARERALVELRAVDRAYPLYGAAEIEPPMPLADALATRGGRPGLVAERVVLDRLGLKPGDTVRLGEGLFEVRGVLALEPDGTASPALLGPRAMIAAGALGATELVQPGSLVHYRYRIRLPEGGDAAAFRQAMEERFGDGGWRFRSFTEAAPGVSRFLGRTALFLTLVGLTALLVGGIGVANGVTAWLEARRRTIATLKCLGAPQTTVFAAYAIQLAAIASAGIALGLAAGLALPWAATRALAGVLPVPPRLGIYPGPLGIAAAFGLLTAATFALWPLARARAIPAAALFRDVVAKAEARPGPRLIAVNALLALLLAGLTIAVSHDRAFAAFFCAGAAGTLALFRLGASALRALAAHAPRSRFPAVRLGLANLHRPGAPTGLMLVSLGLGLSTLAAVALIQGNIQRQVTETIPENAPAFFFIDIQNDQVARFDALARAQAGVSDIRHVPSLRARIVAIDGTPVGQARVAPEAAWALRGDRGLTYSALPPEGTRIVAGAWWPPDYRGEPLVSFDAQLAHGFGIGVGDTLTVNVLGRDVILRIASLRDISWRSLGMNFTLVASPGLLEAAPHTNIATVRATPEAEAPLLRAVTDALPNVSAIGVREALATVSALLGQIGAALASTGAITLVSGALVLAGAIAAGRRRRIHEAVIVKALGATRRQILAAYLVEFGVLGAASGVIAAAVGTAASWAVVTFVIGAEWVFLPGTLAATVLACTAMTMAMGWAGTAIALRARPAPLLRAE